MLEILGNNVDYAICSNLEGIDSPEFKNELDCNLQMLKVAKQYPKLKPLAVCQPNISEDEKTIRKLLKENSFKPR